MENPKLSTMVVLYTLNVKLNTNELLVSLPLTDRIIKVEKRGTLVRGESSRDKIKRRPKKEGSTSKTGFGHNSITVVVLDSGGGALPSKEITVKIFQNGVFHFTGVLDDLYDASVLKLLLGIISTTCNHCITNDCKEISILERRVVLMNYTSELTKKGMIARETLLRSIRALRNPDISVTYDPDVYPGIKIKYLASKWTANLFRTGKIILTGLTSKQHCEDFKLVLEDLLKKTLP
jgi:hypothetical protein